MHKHCQEIEEVQTWRELLRKVTARPDERQRIAAALRINTITITRWVAGSSKPRIETLRALPQALPKQSEQMIRLLKLEYPDLFTNEQTADIESAIPHDFYSQVLNTYAMDPERLCASALSSTILRQIILQCDPDKEGFAVFIAQCVPPGPDQKVRSLRITVGDGGTPVTNVLRNQTCFCGAESQAGLAVLSAHAVIFQNPENQQRIIPGQQIIVPGSSLALPLLRYDSSIGSVCFVSPQKNFFTPGRMSLLKHYVNLLTIAFEPHEFYPLSNIHLAMMPTRSQQHPFLSTLQKRITARMLTPLSEGLPLSRLQAEQQIIKETEEELIQLSLTAELRSEAFIG
ncbi:MAG: GAF domain-containing protein [Ktedonobacteraceae bacterium]|nr:GAF domain-containing protein [Ktedonobacteraceae bacterium]